MIKIMVGDCLARMKELGNESVQCCVTSPPYFGLRDYGVEGQIGLEETPEDYVCCMVEVFREVRRVLKNDGTLWLNIGDSYAGSWGNAGGHNRGNGTQRNITVGSLVKDQAQRNGSFVPPAANGYANLGIKKKDLIGIPWMLAFALRADGWYLRQDIIWHKPNPMPESIKDRCTKAHEYIFLLSKSPKYYFDNKAIMEPAQYGEQHANKATSLGTNRKHPNKANVADYAFAGDNHTTSTTKPYKGAHFATFPPDLIEPCILAGCPEGGIVLDPFGGAGTTGLVAQRFKRDAILCELNPDYAKLAEKRICDDSDSSVVEIC